MLPDMSNAAALDPRDTLIGRYQVMERAACMPASCWGKYSKIGVVRVRGSKPVNRIDARITDILSVRDRLHAGGDRSAARLGYSKALAEAQALHDEDVWIAGFLGVELGSEESYEAIDAWRMERAAA